MPPLLTKVAYRGILAFCHVIMAPATWGASTVSEEEWFVFFREAEPTGFIISIDLAVSSGRVAPTGLNCLEMRFQFSPDQLAQNGMPGEEAQTAYYAAEERIEESIKPKGGRIAAARTGQNARSTWVCGPAEIAPAVQTVIDTIKGFDVTLRPASLVVIKSLHPTLLESQLARNRQLFDHITQKGDDLSGPRKTTHYIYGLASANRPLIEARLKALGFQPEMSRPDAPVEASLFFRFAPLELDALDRDVRSLSKLCAEFGCEYDGWETEVVKQPKN